MARIGELCDQAGKYLDPGQVETIYNAYLFGAEAHLGQQRASGEPYISHPVEVARVLADLHLDVETVVAGVLHDTLEDTAVGKDRVARQFGKEVANLVDGVTKLSQIEEATSEAASRAAVQQAENYRKMLLAMTDDVRVMLVKLADRLHNMRTIDALDGARRRRIARETLEIYAPIASRLGLNSIKEELEDRGFRTLYPNRYRVLQEKLRETRGNRRRAVKRIQTAIRRRLRQEGLEGRVLGREKHVYSVYRKMREKRLALAKVLDVYGVRVLVQNVDMCYRVLGCVHNLYKPRPGRFKDYIAIPKSNGYQSLHTVLFGPDGLPLEVQIRSEEMHAIAESGIAAHALYKQGGARENAAHRRAQAWMREILEIQKTAGDPVEFIEHVKVDLFPDTVFVFTPAGEIMELARGSTPVDFAYAVHTDIGDGCRRAVIDGQAVSLRTPLATGQTVEIVTERRARPDPSWLNFVVTGKARARIRSYQKKLRHDEAVKLGRRLLEHALKREALSLRKLPKAQERALLDELGCENRDALLAEIGLGRRTAALVARRLAASPEAVAQPSAAFATAAASGAAAPSPRTGASGGGNGAAGPPLFITGTEGMVVNLGRCCRPIPGDPIAGYLSSGRGLVVHTRTCGNLPDLDAKHECIDVDWEPDIERTLPVDIRIEVENRKGILATVAAAISSFDINIDSVQIVDRDGIHSGLEFTVEVRDRTHLARVFRRLRSIPLVRRIARRT